MGNPVRKKLAPGLYLIATPIGAARDITLRALDLLDSVDVLAAEDTRSLRKLMDIHGVALRDRPLISYHDHNAANAVPRVLGAIEAGKSVLYASEAGSPMVSDPGYELARAVVEADHHLISAPGPSAAIAALTLAGLPSDKFFFAGFLPPKSAKRKTALGALAGVPGTLIFYESPRRLGAMLSDAAEILGGSRQTAVCREITKKFEEVRRDTLEALSDAYQSETPKGEIVVLISQGDSETVSELDLESELKAALAGQSLRDAVDFVSAKFGLKRRLVYRKALELGSDQDHAEDR